MMPTRLLLLAGEFPPFTGGIAHAAAQLATALSQNGIAVTVIAPRYPDRDSAFNYRQPYRLIRLPLMRLRYLRMTPMIPIIIAVAMKDCPDWVVAMRATREGIPALVIKKALGVPFITFAHALEFLRFAPNSLAWRICRWIYDQADGIAAISSSTKAALLQRGLSPSKVQIVHWGVDTATNQLTSPDSDRALDGISTLLTVGRLVPRKGVDKVIESLPFVLKRHPNVRYYVVGDGPDRQRLQQLAYQVGVADHVVFTGRVPDVRPYLRSCNIFVMPTREERQGDIEGFGLVYLEAAIMGKPVIASPVGGAVDAVVNEKTGLFVNPLDPQEIASAVCRLLDSPELARQMGEAGRQRVLREFTWEHTVKRLLALMSEARA